jgi:hypothetical protein
MARESAGVMCRDDAEWQMLLDAAKNRAEAAELIAAQQRERIAQLDAELLALREDAELVSSAYIRVTGNNGSKWHEHLLLAAFEKFRAVGPMTFEKADPVFRRIFGLPVKP